MKQVKKKLAITFNIIDIALLVFYIKFKITYNCERKIIKLSRLDYSEKLLN